MRCVYCELDAGEYDEHPDCLERSLEAAVDEELAPCDELELEALDAGSAPA